MTQELGPRSGRIYRELRQQIEEECLPVAAPLPSQTALARQYGVALMTVRQALERLEDEGFISARVGSGTYVRTRTPPGARTLQSLRAMFTASPVSIVSLDCAGLITSWNPAAERMFGWTEEEVLGKWTPVLPEDQRHEIQTLLRQVVEGGPIHGMELLRQRKDGVLLPVSVSTAPLHDTDGRVTGVMVIYLDLTARKQVEETLRESRERFESAFQFSAIGMALVSLDGRWLQVNRAVCELVGYSEDELLVSSFQDITHPDDLDADLALVQRVLAGEIRTYQMEKRYIRKDRRLVWALLTVSLVHTGDGAPLYFISQIQDITERKRTEKALQASELRFRTLVERAPVGVCVMTEPGIFEQVNEAYAGLVGYTPGELMGRHFSLIVPQGQLTRMSAMHEQRFKLNPESVDEFNVLRKDGREVTVLTTASPLESIDEKPRRVIFVLDITARKRVEAALHHQAHHDILTGLANRLLLQDRMHQVLAHAKRHGEVVGLLFVDLDEFKGVNDRFGHAAGDDLLKLVAQRLASSTRSSDTVARLAGDEFVVVLPDIGSATNASRVAEKVLESLHEPFPCGEETVTLGASIGISLYPFDGATLQALLNAADEAMYRAKGMGKNMHVLSNMDMVS